MHLIRTVTPSKILHTYTSKLILKMSSNCDWRGVPLSEIYGSQSPWGAPEFPLITPSFKHAVLFHVPSSGCVTGNKPPKPQIGYDKWDHDFVRMPCSSQSLYPVVDDNEETHLKGRWNMIEDALKKPIRNSSELAETILTYNSKFKNMWKFKALHKLFNECLEEEEAQYFFDVTLPEIAKLALALPKLIQSPIPLLKQHKNQSISLSQQQVASLLANAFFCTFPRRNTTKKTSEYASYPHINFYTLYNTSGSDATIEKLKCICHYFRRVCTKVPVGVMTFSRRSVPPVKCPDWIKSDRTIASLPLHVDPYTKIEDAHGLIQVDFANKYLGGGVLGYGSVQEEIRFMICPELLVSMLFTEVLRPNEALMIIGSEQYSKYSGYGSSFEWTGNHTDETPYDSSSRRRCAVLAIDALHYAGTAIQYRPQAFTRELNKAWVGLTFYSDVEFEGPQYPGVATGNWGCGAFNGSPILKSLLQIMACSQSRRPMAYYTFGDIELRDKIVNVYNMLSRYNVTVGQLYKCLLQFSQTNVVEGSLYGFIQKKLINSQTNSTEDNAPTTSAKINVPEKNCDVDDSKQLPHHNVSPDLFSQEESDSLNLSQEQMEIDKSKDEIEETGLNKSENKTLSNIKTTASDNKIMENKNKMSNDSKTLCNDNKTLPNKRKPMDHSSLLDEIARFEEESGGSSLLSTRHSTFRLGNVSINDSEPEVTSQGDEKLQISMSEDVKKKIGKKITDYFSKKCI